MLFLRKKKMALLLYCTFNWVLVFIFIEQTLKGQRHSYMHFTIVLCVFGYVFPEALLIQLSYSPSWNSGVRTWTGQGQYCSCVFLLERAGNALFTIWLWDLVGRTPDSPVSIHPTNTASLHAMNQALFQIVKIEQLTCQPSWNFCHSYER